MKGMGAAKSGNGNVPALLVGPNVSGVPDRISSTYCPLGDAVLQ